MGGGRGRRIAGVVESVLGRVLEAFQRRVAAALGGSAAGALAAGAPLARLMAAEAAAPQAGTAAAFFAGRAGDSAGAFVTEVVSSGASGFCDRGVFVSSQQASQFCQPTTPILHPSAEGKGCWPRLSTTEIIRNV